MELACAKLNLGCGRRLIEGATNLDMCPDVNPDLVHDLNQRPWPLPDGEFEEVLAYDVIEHCGDLVGVMEEVHRVCRDAAIVRITVPHFSCSNTFADPTHRHAFTSRSFEYFTDEAEFDFYTRCRFRRRATNIVFAPTLLNKLVWRIANRWPREYERRWAWVFPAWFIYCELEVVKTVEGRAS
ncbi:MAG: class I SAM-dependent methyltransferase [Candidatus Binataceae bacterium]